MFVVCLNKRLLGRKQKTRKKVCRYMNILFQCDWIFYRMHLDEQRRHIIFIYIYRLMFLPNTIVSSNYCNTIEIGSLEMFRNVRPRIRLLRIIITHACVQSIKWCHYVTKCVSPKCKIFVTQVASYSVSVAGTRFLQHLFTTEKNIKIFLAEAYWPPRILY